LAAASARRRTTNNPTRLPSTTIEESSSWFGSSSVWVKNSIVPTISPGPRIGKQSAAHRPPRAAAWARGKLASASTSTIHAGSPLDHTRPGRPCPRASVIRSLSERNSCVSVSGACQTATQRRSSPDETSHAAPRSQPSAVPISARTRSYVSSASAVSASARATASSIPPGGGCPVSRARRSCMPVTSTKSCDSGPGSSTTDSCASADGAVRAVIRSDWAERSPTRPGRPEFGPP
jgi:hypothetical protein